MSWTQKERLEAIRRIAAKLTAAKATPLEMLAALRAIETISGKTPQALKLKEGELRKWLQD